MHEEPARTLPHDPTGNLDAAYRAPEAIASPLALDPADLDSADPLKRMGAWMLDCFLVALIFVGSVVLFVALLEAELSLAMQIAGAVVLLLVVTTPNIVLMSLRGQTLGKMLMRIRVVTIQGGRCGFVRGVVLRLWMPWMILSTLSGVLDGVLGTTVPGTLLIAGFFIGETLLLFSREGRGIEDRLAGTRVIAVANE